MLNTFSSANFRLRCDELAGSDADLAAIIRSHGYPPMWNRPNTFETLVHFILEQQVSLASALSALNKLRKRYRRSPHKRSRSSPTKSLGRAILAAKKQAT